MIKIIDVLKGIWNMIVIFSLINVISFVAISCCLIWAYSIVLVVHINPDFDISLLSVMIMWMIRIFIFEVVILVIYFMLVPAISKLLSKRRCSKNG